MMSVKFSPNALDQFLYLEEHDKILFKKSCKIIRDTQRNGKGGLGHPEPLRGDLSGWWSKQTDKGDRVVFKIIEEENTVHIGACYGHYDNLE